MSSVIKSTFKVQDLKNSINFYTKCLGMKQIETKSENYAELSFENSNFKSLRLVEVDKSEKLQIGDVYKNRSYYTIF